jgi:hypothetical protein
MTSPLAIGAAGVGAIALLASTKGRQAIGVNIPAYVTDAHRPAMGILQRAILEVPASADTMQATHRYNEIMRTLMAFRGFLVVSAEDRSSWWDELVQSKGYPNLSGSDVRTILNRFLEAARAGVDTGTKTYRLSTSELFPTFGGAQSVPVDRIFAGAWGTQAGPADTWMFPLTSFGRAVLNAARERDRAVWDGGAITGADLARFDAVAFSLANEMDYAGYLESGKPPPDPTIAGGIAYAASKSGQAVASIAGDAAAGLATSLVGSPWLWMAAIGLVAWKVLR